MHKNLTEKEKQGIEWLKSLKFDVTDEELKNIDLAHTFSTAMKMLRDQETNQILEV
jgi:hypothetical protein